MPKTGDEPDDAERVAAHAEPNKEAWAATLQEMQALAAEREDRGWDAVTVGAGHTAPVSRDAGDADRYGLVYVVPGNRAEPFREAYERGEYPRYEVYRGATETRVFLVTELVDPGVETAILLAGNFRRRDARGLVRTVRETGRMFTHVQKLDGTHLGSFEHEDYEKFFPEADLAARHPDEE